MARQVGPPASSAGAPGCLGSTNPFAAIEPPPTEFLIWVVFWFAAVLTLSVWSFRTREI